MQLSLRVVSFECRIFYSVGLRTASWDRGRLARIYHIPAQLQRLLIKDAIVCSQFSVCGRDGRGPRPEQNLCGISRPAGAPGDFACTPSVTCGVPRGQSRRFTQHRISIFIQGQGFGAQRNFLFKLLFVGDDGVLGADRLHSRLIVRMLYSDTSR